MPWNLQSIILWNGFWQISLYLYVVVTWGFQYWTRDQNREKMISSKSHNTMVTCKVASNFRVICKKQFHKIRQQPVIKHFFLFVDRTRQKQQLYNGNVLNFSCTITSVFRYVRIKYKSQKGVKQGTKFLHDFMIVYFKLARTVCPNQ